MNTEKTKIVIFRRGGRGIPNSKFFYSGIELEVVKCFNYLGVVFTSAVNTFSGKTLKAIYSLSKSIESQSRTYI